MNIVKDLFALPKLPFPKNAPRQANPLDQLQKATQKKGKPSPT
ncbi:hypothetical protein PORCRE_1723 [Porphyromonas crevioricanis JCM 15906]|uniref:Uncharacterized protein n=1 Tax=Porphyromonas crevioricanis JCM 15906 TaxID=1305617 RepID=T1CSA3_9PORP|nr:hypothetical protein PORCRE_1723 [Porphyromonas crevioricanis JCM 15906]GAD08465.1 hypothetical protein PORCAN_2107 [Porphyromonas crevioricanis JCM 13913]